jgi:hypothetical protein
MGNNDKGVCPVCRKEGVTSCNVIEQGTGGTEGQKKRLQKYIRKLEYKEWLLIKSQIFGPKSSNN